MAGIFVRGLTGNKVNVFVDGVRYSNGAQRGGVNTFLDLIDPSTLEGIESPARHVERAVRQRRARRQRAVPDAHAGARRRPCRRRSAASVTVGGETGHQGGVGSAFLNYARPNFGLSGSFSGRKTGDYRPGGGATTRTRPCCGSSGSRRTVCYPDADAGHRLHAARRAGARQLGAVAEPAVRRQLHQHAPGRREPLGSDCSAATAT